MYLLVVVIFHEVWSENVNYALNSYILVDFSFWKLSNSCRLIGCELAPFQTELYCNKMRKFVLKLLGGPMWGKASLISGQTFLLFGGHTVQGGQGDSILALLMVPG